MYSESRSLYLPDPKTNSGSANIAEWRLPTSRKIAKVKLKAP
jgi:hypothetical protein